MKTKLFTFFFALAASVGTLFAESGTCGDNLQWSFDSETGVLTITGDGPMTDFEWDDEANHPLTPWYALQPSIQNIIFPEGLTSIGNEAFDGCPALQSISLPDKLVRIGECAFQNCPLLTTITLPSALTSIGTGAFIECSALQSIHVDAANENFSDIDGVLFNKEQTHLISYPLAKAATAYTIPEKVVAIDQYAFYECDGVNSIILPSTLTEICGYAFYRCSGLISVEIPNSVTSIGTGAFYECSGLKSVTLPNNLTSLENNTFCYCSGLTSLEIPNSVTSIGGYAFYNCSSLTSVTIPNSVTSIGQSAFNGCSGLTSIDIPNSVTSIGEDVFSGCLGLTSVTIPNSVTSIGGYAFYQCTGLTSVEIPNSVTSIGNYAFYQCSGLTSVEIPNSVTSIGNGAFERCTGLASVEIPNSVTGIGGWVFYECSGLTSVDIPNSVISIGDQAFSGCKSLTSITLPNSVTSIGNEAFSSCSGLKSVTIGNGVTSIGNWAFSYCDGLTSLEIPNSVTSIGECAFYNCTSLKSVIIGNSVTSIGEGAFNWCIGLTSLAIPSSVTSIGDYAFLDIPNIVYNGTASGSPWGAKCVNGYIEDYLVYADETKTTLLGCSPEATGEIIIPNSVINVGDYIFRHCSRLTLTSPIYNEHVFVYMPSSLSGASYAIPYGIEKIAGGAFDNCSRLTSIEIPNSVTTIGRSAFYASALTSVTIPSSVTSLGESVFEYCIDLTAIYVAAENPSYSSIDGVLFDKAQNTLIEFPCGRQGAYTIPNSVKSIGNYAFEYCSGLTSVTIPNRVTSIGECAFAGCINLTSVTLPHKLKSIEYRAFNGCSGLTSVTIGSGVTSIGDQVFAWCSGLTNITCEAVTPPTCGEYAFSNVDKSIPLYVPLESVNDYKNADKWKDFGNIQPIQAVEVEVATIVVDPAENSVVVEWPEVSGAAEYIIQIWKGEALICTLSFNELGQLLTISFEKKADKDNQIRNAAQTDTGWQFTINGLDEDTQYVCVVSAKNNEDTEIFKEETSFRTKGEATNIEQSDASSTIGESRKYIRNGRLHILRDGKTYTVQGQEVE